MNRKYFLFILMIYALGMVTSPGLGYSTELNATSSENSTVSSPLYKMGTVSNDIGGGLLWKSQIAWITQTLAVSDFNNDGIDDILASDRDPQALDGDATGTSLWTHNIPFGYLIDDTATADFNNDGTPDAVVGSYDNNTYAINGIDGSLLWNFTDATDDIISVAVGDFNNDGIPDVVVGSRDNTTYAINGVDGTQLWNNTDVGDSVVHVAVGDFNNDHIDDVVVAGGNFDTTVYAMDGPTGTQLWNNTDPLGGFISLIVLDFDRDNIDDVLVGEIYFSIFAINSTGVTSWTAPVPAASLAYGDFNSDGVTEIAATSNDKNVYIIETSSGGISRISSYSNSHMFEIAIGDVNGDGIDDIITGGLDTNVYAIHGLSGELLWKFTDPSNTITDIKLGYFNGDETLDVVVASRDAYTYVLTGYSPPSTKLEISITLSKTYVNLTNDWTLAKVLVTNIGAFPAFDVLVALFAPDGSDELIGTFESILPSRSKLCVWNLTSGKGLPTTKVVNALEVSYTVSVIVAATNSPWQMASIPIIVDPPLDEVKSPRIEDSVKLSQLESIFTVMITTIASVGAIGVLGIVYYKKRLISSESLPSGD